MQTEFLEDVKFKNCSILSEQDKNYCIISNIVEAIREILRYDKTQSQPLFLKVNDGFIFNIARKILVQKTKTLLVGITGESASGKTTFVQSAINSVMMRQNSEICSVVCCDDYYKDTSYELEQAGSYENLYKSGFSFDTPDVIDLKLMKEHLLKLKNGEEIYSPKYDFVTCRSSLDVQLKKPAKVVLNEGLYVLTDDLKDIMDVKVYVFTPFNVIRDRWYQRAASRGKSGSAADMQFEDVNRTAQIYIRPALQHADVVLNGLVSCEYIEELVDKIFKAIQAALGN